jgi:hypothetical protein
MMGIMPSSGFAYPSILASEPAILRGALYFRNDSLNSNLKKETRWVPELLKKV